MWIGTHIVPTGRRPQVKRVSENRYKISRYLQPEPMVSITPLCKFAGFRKHGDYAFEDNKRLFLKEPGHQPINRQGTNSNVEKFPPLYTKVRAREKFGLLLFGIIYTPRGYADVRNTPVQNMERREKNNRECKFFEQIRVCFVGKV